MMVLLESFMMGGMSVLSGIALGFAINLYMKNVGIDLSGHISSITYAGGTILPRVHSEIDPGYQMMAATLLLLVCLAAGFLPANRAANMHPVQAMRGD
jgi:ABC-type antimicrobial peptide transport system permease subunit